MKQLLIILIFAVLISCTSYKKEFTQALSTSLSYTAYKSETKVDLKPEVFQEVKNWFIENSDGWETSYVTHVPQDILRNNNISINITKNLIVVNMKKSNGSWIQVSKPVNSKDIPFVQKIKKKTEQEDQL